MIDWTLRQLHDRVFFPARNKALVKRLAPFLDDCTSVLDLGASDGRLAADISGLVNARFVGCDVHLQPKSLIPVHQYDGKTLPFDDNSFDCVMLIDMLHHTNDIREMLLEAKRVASKFLLVKDHYWLSRIGYWNLATLDYIANKPYGIPVPFNFLRLEEWTELFEKTDCEVLAEEKFRLHRADIIHHITVKLRV